jgi:hypothetical protein
MTKSSCSLVLTHHKAHSGVFGRQDGKDLLLRITGVVCFITPTPYLLIVNTTINFRRIELDE